jgi:hypothetical protein
MEVWGGCKRKITAKNRNHQVSKPKQERNATKKSLLPVQNIIPRGKKIKIIKKVYGWGYAERRPHFHRK